MVKYSVRAASSFNLQNRKNYDICMRFISTLQCFIGNIVCEQERNIHEETLSKLMSSDVISESWADFLKKFWMHNTNELFNTLSEETISDLISTLSYITFSKKPTIDSGGHKIYEYRIHYGSKDVRPSTVGAVSACCQQLMGDDVRWIIPYVTTCNKLIENSFRGGVISAKAGVFSITTEKEIYEYNFPM